MTRKDAAYGFILDRIMTGEYGAGAKLSEVAIAKEIGVSATPVREAYRQLASEGVVSHIPNRGVFVNGFSGRDVEALYEARELFETFAVRRAVHRIGQVGMADLRRWVEVQHRLASELRESGADALTPEAVLEWLEADLRFHLAILRAAENPVVLGMVRDSHMLSRILGYRLHRLDLKQVSDTWHHHQRVLSAFEDSDADAAERRMREHLRFSVRTALERQQNETSPAGGGREAFPREAAALARKLELEYAESEQ